MQTPYLNDGGYCGGRSARFEVPVAAKWRRCAGPPPPSNMNAPHYFEMSWISNPMTSCNIQEDRRPQNCGPLGPNTLHTVYQHFEDEDGPHNFLWNLPDYTVSSLTTELHEAKSLFRIDTHLLQKKKYVLWKLQVHYRVNKSSSLDHLLRPINAAHTPFHVSPAYGFQILMLVQGFKHNLYATDTANVPRAPPTPTPALSWFHHPAQIMKILTVQISPPSCHFIHSSRAFYPPLHVLNKFSGRSIVSSYSTSNITLLHTLFLKGLVVTTRTARFTIKQFRLPAQCN